LTASPIPFRPQNHEPLLTQRTRLADPYIADVDDRASFARFVGQLVENYLEHPEDWEHTRLVDFLEALQAHALDINRHYRVDRAPDRLEEEPPSWRHFADILLHARVGGSGEG
jgi:hypothetical protein